MPVNGGPLCTAALILLEGRRLLAFGRALRDNERLENNNIKLFYICFISIRGVKQYHSA